MIAAFALDMADGALQSLSFQACSFEQAASVQQELARLTGLTHLELAGQGWSPSDDYATIRGLQLVELILLDCQDLGLKLFTPGAFRALPEAPH